MKGMFTKITYITQGHEFDLIVNVNDIARLSYGFNQIGFKTQFPDGLREVTVTQSEFERLEKLLLNLENC